MGRVFEIKLARNRLEAELDLRQGEGDAAISMDDLAELLAEQKIVHGVKTEVLKQVAADPASIAFPVVIAEGVAPQNGSDAYLRNEIKEMDAPGTEHFNFRVVMRIPSVKQGQLLATVVLEGHGENGVDVTGQPIMAKPGRPLRVRAGKNVVQKEGRFYAAVDGEVSITKRTISVNPVFEVKGDLDLKTGNIDFVGNITIHGNVPSGYELKAGGDIRINGMVEAAILEAEGNIIVDGGIAGGMKGKVLAGGNIQANYLNQASVRAGQDLYIKTSILHSSVNAGGNVDCRYGKIIGGTLTAGRIILVKDLGNELFTKTELAVGWDPALEKREQDTLKSLVAVDENIRKLASIESKLSEIAKLQGRLNAEQKQMLHKQQVTRLDLEKQAAEMKRELETLHAEKIEKQNSTLWVFGKAFPNVKVYFGKYAFMTNKMYEKVIFSLEHGEVNVNPADGAVKIH
ncbi:FapA family protein [Bacillus sp. REN3]|uniref:DUF342 domain-containing protein n=1 Tax=Bacillus sp. REN3 TaxID=2802440 RepID=UPI001AEE0858|nr:FapA family protein [Bacillus sp. REN3]